MMTDEQATAEYHYYLWLCQKKYPSHYKTCQSIDSYTPEQRNQAAAETAYFEDKRRLPTWATIIEHVLVQPNGDVFVHRDPTITH